ncbi:imidazole glycerol phosphate synthase subunit HisH [Planctomicrobium sp. SH661]|uniref:imidazole glycerol phosphate synthase subunit HisH n=1 Tax=Planctomicrobium sp. SH661 TaxID=3448124 RepID=UPI003F5BA2DA
MIGIIDYGMGNLRSVQKALERLGHSAEIVSQSQRLSEFTGLILPGVGAFRDAIAELQRQDFVNPIHDYIASGQPLLGICLGMQLLFDRSYEDGDYQGLGVIPGEVVRFQPEPGLKIPHMGWNSLEFDRENPLLRGVRPGDYVYFVHSYHVCPQDADVVTARTRHGSQTFVSIVNQRNVYATQFHPEKSQQVGLQILKNFVNLIPNVSEVDSKSAAVHH